MSQFWKVFCNLLVVSNSLCCGFHPQTDAHFYLLVIEVETKLCILCEQDPTKWSHNLQFVEHALALTLSHEVPLVCFLFTWSMATSHWCSPIRSMGP